MTVPSTRSLNITMVGVGQAQSGVVAWCLRNYKALLGELTATFLLVLLGCMTCLPLEGVEYTSPIYGSIGFGFIVTLNIQIFSHISGAHMNPAVTIAGLIFGYMTDVTLGFMYIVAQCIGSTLGYGVMMALSAIDLSENYVCVTYVYPSFSIWQAIVVEAIATSALNLLNCAVWDPVNKTQQDSISIKYGMTIAALSLVAGPMTGASINPARSLGPAIWTGHWEHHWVFWVGPIIGSIVPTLIYKYLWLDRKNYNQEEK